MLNQRIHFKVFCTLILMACVSWVQGQTTLDGQPQTIINVTTEFNVSPSNPGDVNAAGIQSAIRKAKSMGGGIIYIPAGIYNVEKPTGKEGRALEGPALLVDSNGEFAGDRITFRGDGAQATVLRLSGPFIPTHSNPLIKFSGVSDVAMLNLTLDGNGRAIIENVSSSDTVRKMQSHAIEVENVIGMVVKGVNFYDTYGDGIKLFGNFSDALSPTMNVSVTDSQFYANRRNGITVLRNTRDIRISDNYFVDVAVQAIDMEPHGCAVSTPVDIVIDRNYFSCDGSGTPCIALGGGLVFKSSYDDSNVPTDLLGADGMPLPGTVATCGADPLVVEPIPVSVPASSVVFSNNTVENGQLQAIYLNDSVIEGNTIENHRAASSLVVRSETNGLTVANNVIRSAGADTSRPANSALHVFGNTVAAGGKNWPLVPSNLTIAGNTMSADLFGINIQSVHSVAVVGNSISREETALDYWGGIHVRSALPTRGVVVANNIVRGFASNGVRPSNQVGDIVLNITGADMSNISITGNGVSDNKVVIFNPNEDGDIENLHMSGNVFGE